MVILDVWIYWRKHIFLYIFIIINLIRNKLLTELANLHSIGKQCE